ncbi:MAG: glycosyltransferase family 4 protein [Candidatus Methanoperedens sp.]|nr:glycosyltransferase family 4 protein [Candidatus Methanoperedens sp.]
MRICLVGDFSSPDEARKVMGHHLLRELSKNNEVKPLNIQATLSTNFWNEINSFDPEIIHYIPGASPLSFLITKLMKIHSKNAKTVMFSSLHAFHSFSHGFYYGFSSISKNFIPFFKTDLVLVQSDEPEKIFTKLGCNVKFFVSSGVDIKKFHPASRKSKEELREKYKISSEKFVVLHVGSVRKWRNVSILKEIQNNQDVQVVLVGRTSTKFEVDVALELKRIGVEIINEYIPKIEEIYALSDCYIFPTTDPIGSIDIPLSILEAMATNLPIVSTRFGGLPRIFNEGEGFTYADTKKFAQEVKELNDGEISVKTRELVLHYSWENISKKLDKIYYDLRNSTDKSDE